MDRSQGACIGRGHTGGDAAGVAAEKKRLVHTGLVLHFMVQLSISEDADARLAQKSMGRGHHRILSHSGDGCSDHEDDDYDVSATYAQNASASSRSRSAVIASTTLSPSNLNTHTARFS